LPVEGRKNVATRGLVFPTTEEEALWTRWLQARRRRAFRWQLQTTFVRQQLDAANLAEQLDAANLAEQLDAANLAEQLDAANLAEQLDAPVIIR
jgi:hypothetical protein